VADVPSGLRLTPPREREKRENYILTSELLGEFKYDHSNIVDLTLVD
jgi:hypothetical protein